MEEGTTATFDMVALNRLDRRRLMADVIDRAPRLGSSAAYAQQAIRGKLVEHKRCIDAHGIGMPEVRELPLAVVARRMTPTEPDTDWSSRLPWGSIGQSRQRHGAVHRTKRSE